METRFLAKKQRLIMLGMGIICIISLLAVVVYSAFVKSSPHSYANTTNSWVDNFDGTSLNTNFWSVSDYAYNMATINNVHQGYFQPDRVSVSGGYLTLELTQENGTVGTNPHGIISRGGEIATNATYGYGTYQWRMRTSSTASSPTDTTGKVVSGQISAGFTYVNNSESELDLEIEGQYPNQLEMTTWHNTDTSQDPTDAMSTYTSTNVSNMANTFKTYKIVWSAGEVQYYVDNQMVADHTTHVPSAPADVMINHWGTDSSDFGGLATVGTNRYLLVDWASYTAPGDTVPDPDATPTSTQTSTPSPPIPTPTPTATVAAANLLKNASFENTTLSPWSLIVTG